MLVMPLQVSHRRDTAGETYSGTLICVHLILVFGNKMSIFFLEEFIQLNTLKCNWFSLIHN